MSKVTADMVVQFTDPVKYQKLFEKMQYDVVAGFRQKENVALKNSNEVQQSGRRKAEKEIPIWEKSNLTIQEAALYSGIGEHKLRSLTNDEDCTFVLWIGSKRLIKRRQFDEYIDKAYSI